jgi:hypothetical protein
MRIIALGIFMALLLLTSCREEKGEEAVLKIILLRENHQILDLKY